MKIHITRARKDKRTIFRTYCGKPIQSEEMNNHVTSDNFHATCETCCKAWDAEMDKGLVL